MKSLTLDDLTIRNLVHKTTAAYFSTLFETASYFSADGERIRQSHPGYDSRKWLEKITQVTADAGYFRRESMPIEKAVPYVLIKPYLTKEIVAGFCLADDLLHALYYEYVLYDYLQCFSNAPKIPHAVRRRFKELRAARLEFCDQKRKYLRIAYCKHVSRKVYTAYDASSCLRHFVGQVDLEPIFSALPVIDELYPRGVTADNKPLFGLRRKHSHLLAFCDEAMASLPD